MATGPRTGAVSSLSNDSKKRRELLETAAELFGEIGYRATTVRMLADARGILSGSLYSHISSKEDLLYEIAVLDAEIFRDALKPIVEGPGTVAERFRLGLKTHIELVAQYGNQARVFLLEFRELKTPERRTKVIDLRDEYEDLWQRLIAEGQAAGEFRASDTKLARIVLMSVANWTYLWLNPEGGMKPGDIADGFSDLLLGGLLTDRL